MEIGLFRHGQTQGGLEKRYIGATDEPLCAQGIACIRSGGVNERVRKVYVSRLLRAQQTACLWYPKAQQILVPGLEEMDFGLFEGKTYLELQHTDAYLQWLDSFCQEACPGGESRAAFDLRVSRAFLSVVEGALYRQEKRIFIVAHNGTIMSILSQFAQEHKDYFEWSLPYGSGYRLSLGLDLWSDQGKIKVCGKHQGAILDKEGP